MIGGAGANNLDGGGGDDVVDYSFTPGPVDVDLDAGIAADNGFGGSDTLSGIENVFGSAFNDVLTGDEFANIIKGGGGADDMTGGDGDDTYIVDDGGDTVTELAGQGFDTVRSSISYGLGVNQERLILTGSDNIDGNGNPLDNILIGNSGNNQLSGGAGADEMRGFDGDDTYVVNNAGDQVFETSPTDGIGHGQELDHLLARLVPGESRPHRHCRDRRQRQQLSSTASPATATTTSSMAARVPTR